jgi:hypothetical protein
MTNYELFVLADQLANNIEKLKALKGAKFTYGVLKNIDIIEKEIKILTDSAKPSEAFLAYDKKRVLLCEEFAGKDEKGEVKKKAVAGSQNQFEYDIDTESEAWLSAIDALKSENKEIIDLRDEQVKEYNEMLSIDSAVVFHQIKLDDVPNDISLDLMKIVKPFIKE